MERLAEGPVIGDGGFVFALEKRGYVKAGPWTPEATMEHPEAVAMLHEEFGRAGSDVHQTFTFYASEDKLENRGNYAASSYGVTDINRAAMKLARSKADKYGGMMAGGVCQTPTYLNQLPKKDVQEQFRKQMDVFCNPENDGGVDFLIAEYYEHVEECEWALEVFKEANIPLAATLCINDEGDMHGVSTGDCALRMVDAGASIVGINCHFGPVEILHGMEQMANALERNGLTGEVHLMVQPLGYHTPDAGIQGFIDLPEFPFGLEPRICTRWDMHKYARDAWDMGIRYIGGCCGFEAYHIRAVAEELAEERARRPAGGQKWEPWAGGLEMHTKPWVRARANKEYWMGLNPASGRPYSPSISEPEEWGVTQGDDDLHQNKEGTGARDETSGQR